MPHDAAGEIPDILQFEAPPEQLNTRGLRMAEQKCLSFPGQLIDLAAERSELSREMTRAAQERGKVVSLVARNLISIADDCWDVCSDLGRSVAEDSSAPPPEPPPTGDECDSQSAAEEPGSLEEESGEVTWDVAESVASDNEQLALNTVAGVHRMIVYLLEELDIVQLDLLGRTYSEVTVGDRRVDDPFEVIEATQSGTLDQRTVTEVLRALWVNRVNARVVRQGQVKC